MEKRHIRMVKKQVVVNRDIPRLMDALSRKYTDRKDEAAKTRVKVSSCFN